MAHHPFKQVDVFTGTPFRGNPVAVVLDARGLTDEDMQRIANWTNLSETTFVLPAESPDADYRVRIFTPRSELPFAGHPTIGTAHALLEAGLVHVTGGELVQQCDAGLVRLQVDVEASGSRFIAFDLPAPTVTLLTNEEVDELEAILGAPVDRVAGPRLIDVGARWTVAQLASATSVLTVRPDFERMKAQDVRARATGVVIFGAHASDAPTAVEVRAFAPACGVNEDPVCGSGNGCIAVFVRDTGQLARFGSSFLASQGQAVGRAGSIRIGIGPGGVSVGGQAVTCVNGTLSA